QDQPRRIGKREVLAIAVAQLAGIAPVVVYVVLETVGAIDADVDARELRDVARERYGVACGTVMRPPAIVLPSIRGCLRMRKGTREGDKQEQQRHGRTPYGVT